MSWLGWLLALFVAYWFLSDLLRSKRCCDQLLPHLPLPSAGTEFLAP